MQYLAKMRIEAGEAGKQQETELLLSSSKHKDKSLKERFWRYGILICSSLSYALSSGFSFGIAGSLTVVNSVRFDISLQRASWSVAVHTVFFLMMSPLSAVLAKLVSIRKVQMLGCVMSILGIGLCGFATEHWHIILLFGIVAGIGLSLVRCSLLGILPYHFEEQSLHMAIAAATCGYFAGYLLVPVPASYLFMTYGFNHAMLIASSVMLLHIPGVIFFTQGEKFVKNEPHHKVTSLRNSLFEILTDLKLWLMLLSSFVRKVGFSGYFTIYQDYADHELNLSLTDSGTAGTVFGVTAIIGCAVISITHAFGWKYNKIIALSLCAVLAGGAICLVSIARTQKEFYIYNGFFGLFNGLLFGNLLGLGSEIVGERNFVLMVGFDACAQGIGGSIGPSTASYLQEDLNYKIGILASGGAFILCGVVNALIGLVKYIQNRPNSQKDLHSDTCQQ